MFLICASVLLLVVIAVQNYLYPPLRQETISDGLYGPYHWWLDGAYVMLSIALGCAFYGKGLGEVFASIAALSLMVTAVSNTFSTWVDRVTGGLHSKIHTIFTGVMFLSMLGLQAVENRGSMWILSVAGLAVPAILYIMASNNKAHGIVDIAPGPAAEKTAVAFLCAWLIVWSMV